MKKQTWEEYRAVPALNASTLVYGLRSMRHLKAAIDQQLEESPTDSMGVGTCAHVLLLEPDEFEQRFIVEPQFHLDPGNVDAKGKQSSSHATTYVKERRREFAEANTDREIVPAGVYNTAAKAIRALRSHHSATRYLNGCECEVSVTGMIAGEWCKGRLDAIGSLGIIDLKTTADITQFGRRFGNLHYGFRLGLYRELVLQTTGDLVDVFVIAQETSGAYDTAVFRVPEAVLDSGLSSVKRVIGQLRASRDLGTWPGIDHGENELPLEVPLWSMPDDEVLTWEP